MAAPDRAHYDVNLKPTLIAVSNGDGITPVSLWADPNTHGLIFSATIGGQTIPAASLTTALAVQIVDGSGNQIASFGGGTQYANGAVQATPTGTVALGWDGTNIRALSTDSSGRQILSASSLVIGKVGIDQTTPGTTNAVSANQGTAAALTAGWPTINGEAADVTGTFTNATQTTSVTANNLDGYGNTLISINGTYGTATAIFEGSDDAGTTWYTVQAARDNTNVIETGYTSQTNTSQTWQINNPGFDSLRVRSTAVASGTVNVRLSSSAAPVASGTIVGLGTAIPVGTNPIGSVNLSPTAVGGYSAYALGNGANAVLTTTQTVSAVAGKFGGYMTLINLNSAPAYIQVFDTTGAVTLGTTQPNYIIAIPANATAANGLAANIELANGIAVTNGLKIAATTTSNGASTVSTGVSGTILFK